MKSRIFLLLIIQTMFSVEAVFAQITFQKTFGGSNSEEPRSIQQTTDGGYIIAGWSHSLGVGSDDVYLIKTDAYGDSLWTRTFGRISSDFCFAVQQTTDGGYIIIGQTQGFGAPGGEVYLIKTDLNGDSLWTKTFGGSYSDIGWSIQQTTDGGYIITGTTSSFGAGNYDVYLIKTDMNGDLLWTKTLGGTFEDLGSSIQQTMDGGYIVTGTTSSFGAGNYDVYLIKTDANGNSLWSKTFGGTDNDGGASVHQTTDGGYVITGTTHSFGLFSNDVYLIKTDSLGNSLWTKTFGGTGDDDGYSVQQTTDGGYIINGTTHSFGVFDVYLIKTDVNGDTLWTKTFGGAGGEFGYAVRQTTDGGYILTGLTQLSFSTGSVGYLIKTDANGNSGCNEGGTSTLVNAPTTLVGTPSTIVSSQVTILSNLATIVGSGGTFATLCTTVGVPPIFNFQSSIFNISPNPFSNEINITSAANDLSEIILYDITSRKLLQQTFTGSASLNTSQLSKGIYIYEVRNINAVIKKGKVIKE